MSSEPPRRTVDLVTADYLAQCEAMTSADTDVLSGLLAAGFTLTHMTGYRQSKAEWLEDLASGRMTYHCIRNVDVTVDVGPGLATLTGRSRTHATIWGTEGTWQLQLRVTYASTPTGWLAQRTVASTW